jgi:hypothetical protein
MTDELRCRACGAAFPRSARIEDLCPPCRVSRPGAPGIRNRVLLMVAAVVAMTAMSAILRVMLPDAVPVTDAERAIEIAAESALPGSGSELAARTEPDPVATPAAGPERRRPQGRPHDRIRRHSR